MLGLDKKVERVRVALHDALIAKAKMVMELPSATQNGIDHARTRAMVLLDIADVIRTIGVDSDG